jgi:hypothetical protein
MSKTNRFPMSGQQLDDLYEERAAIFEANSNVSLWEVGNQAAQSLGFDNKVTLKAAVQSRKAREEKEYYGEEPCCWCNDEGSEDGDGEVHPCTFCGAD